MKRRLIGISFGVALLFVFGLMPSFGAENSTLARGIWQKKSQKISGAWKLVDQGEYKTLQFVGFETKKAPDLQVFLSPHSAKKASNKNATKGALVLGKLKSPKGDQSYRIDGGVDLSVYNSILIHCKKYSKLWGAAVLKPGSAK